jgi:hypothetical protein
MSWACRKLVPASCAGLDFREIEAETPCRALVLSWHGRGVPLGSVGYREASTKANRYA